MDAPFIEVLTRPSDRIERVRVGNWIQYHQRRSSVYWWEWAGKPQDSASRYYEEHPMAAHALRRFPHFHRI